jgi:outer membrane protein assembly factor BamE (lipoprotein component of BamABCDE complex)
MSIFMKYLFSILSVLMLAGCASFDRTKVALTPGMSKDQVVNAVGRPDDIQAIPALDKTSNAGEVWYYYGRESENYQNMEIRFDSSGRYESTKLSGYNYGGAKKDDARRKAQLEENSTLLLYQLEQEDYYYPARQTNTLENMRLNLRTSEETESLNKDAPKREPLDPL